ncbi:formylmethionine deformylase [Streptomyces sp. NPDC004959]|uniref:formylmethionine deformylase n=1 Tax=unclassified Streptomyces TaxID=2593676 RepID=UPI000A9DA4E6
MSGQVAGRGATLEVGTVFLATSRGGDASGGWLLARARLEDVAEAAGWLRGEACRLADRLDPEPGARWARAGAVHPATGTGPDAPAALRAWAVDGERQSLVRELLRLRQPFALRFPDPGGAWYELGAGPVPAYASRADGAPGPPRCEAAGHVTPYVADMALRAARTPGDPPRTLVRCALAPHLTHEHEGIVRELSGPGGHVWGSFGIGVPVWRLRVAAPCSRQAGRGPCGLYADHPGGCVPAA